MSGWGTRAVRLVCVLAAPRGQVWTALSDREHLSQWLGVIEGRLEIGQILGFYGAVVEVSGCRPPERLALRWMVAGESHDLRADLRTVPEGTELTVEHAGMVNPAMVAYGPSWEERLVHLAEHLAGAPAPRHDCARLLAGLREKWWALLSPQDRQVLGLSSTTR